MTKDNPEDKILKNKEAKEQEKKGAPSLGNLKPPTLPNQQAPIVD